MSRNSIYTRVLLVIISIVVLLAFVTRAPHHTSRDTWLPSSFNPVGAGHMAFYQTLQEMNWPVERWQEPLSRLGDHGTGNTMIITRSRLGSRVTFSDQELDLLDDWVKKGNTLVLLGALEEWDDTRTFLEQIGFVLPGKTDSLSSFFQPYDPNAAQTVELPPATNSGQSGTLILPRAASLPLTFPSGTKVLWEQQGKPYLLDLPRGNGHIICAASADLLSNSNLRRGDNLAIVLGLLAPSGQVPKHLFFEESHHGFSTVFAVARLLTHPGVRFAGMLTLLGILALLASSLVRFGPVIPLERESGRSTLEFVDSMADLYCRADLRDETMKYLFTETHHRVLHRLNLPATASHELIASRLQRSNPHLPKWKKLAQRFDSTEYTEGLPPTGWLRVARELIEIKSAMA